MRKLLYFFIAIEIVLIFAMPPLKLFSLHSHYWDFGVFDHFLYIYAKEGNFYWFLKNHFQPILFVYGLLYKIVPSAYWLLLLQSLAVVGAGFLYYSLALRLLGDRFIALVILFVYLFHPMVLYQAFWDFHTDHLLLLFVALFFYIYFFVRRWREPLLLFVLLAMMSVKESAILLALFCSLFLILKREYRVGGVGVVVSLLLFFIVSHSIGPNFYKYSNTLFESWPKPEPSPFPPMYRIWGDSYAQMAWHLLSHPLEVLHYVFGEKYRLIYLLVAFAPLLFFSLLAPDYLFVAIPGFAISLLSSQPEKYMVYHHYPAMVLGVVFVSAIVGMRRAQRVWQRRREFLAYTMIAATLIVSWAYAPTPNGRYFYWTTINDYGYDKYLIDWKKRAAIRKYVPDNYLVSVSVNGGLYDPYLGHRRYYEPWIGRKETDFVVADMRRCEKKERMREKLQKLRGSYHLLYQKDWFFILKKKR